MTLVHTKILLDLREIHLLVKDIRIILHTLHTSHLPTGSTRQGHRTTAATNKETTTLTSEELATSTSKEKAMAMPKEMAILTKDSQITTLSRNIRTTSHNNRILSTDRGNHGNFKIAIYTTTTTAIPSLLTTIPPTAISSQITYSVRIAVTMRSDHKEFHIRRHGISVVQMRKGLVAMMIILLLCFDQPLS
jgi:hypothetical protein